MFQMRIALSSAALLALAACAGSGHAAAPSDQEPAAARYTPQAQYCVPSPDGPVTGSPLCSTIPGNIGPDPELAQKIAYNGLPTSRPTSAAKDVQTPFDNLSWQTFVALNWTKGKENQPAQIGLQDSGYRVWESWPRVSQIFGNGLVQAKCNAPLGVRVFSIASDGQGHPVGQNEEYIQAATGKPAIDVSGNWTIYERRLNDLEVSYLRAPNGNAKWNLTTAAGQKAFIQSGTKVDFPAAGGKNRTGAMEVKAAWRVLDPKQRAVNEKIFYVVPAMLAVAPDLVRQSGKPGGQICTMIDLGLVAMHIIQKNPLTKNSLFPQWFWSTFEHYENAPLASPPCDPTDPAKCPLLGELTCKATANPKATYSYYNKACPDCPTNQPPTAATSGPQFAWNPTPPYAKGYQPTQVSRCWQIYGLTNELNTQWRAQLNKVGSVFQHYMLVGTQWGGNTTDTPNPKIPQKVVPNFLSNSVVETYLQNKPDGSCVTCHSGARLPDSQTLSDLSFLPLLVKPGLVRQPPPSLTGTQ